MSPGLPKLSLLGMAATCSLLGCAPAPGLPPAYADCVPIDDASCADLNYGSGSSTPPGGGLDHDSNAGSIVDAGSCGLDSLALMSANSLCAPCISQLAPTGCCEAALACSTDAVCSARVACGSLGPQGLATCLSVEDMNYAQFLACLGMNCPSVCQDLVLDLTGDQ